MEIEKIAKTIKKNVPICDETSKKPKVAAYVRVSTDSEEQLGSFDSQFKHYANKIKKNPNWEFAGIYSDEGISGTRSSNRNGFLKMMIDSERNKIDIIITKSISRFARNTLDTLKYVRFLKEHNVRVIFEEENIDSLDMQSELILTIVSSVAQQEAINMSNHIKIGKKNKILSGEYLCTLAPYGYKYDIEKKETQINDDEIEILKLIFNKYEELKSISGTVKYLNENKIPTRSGKKYWNTGTLKGILTNVFYVGDILHGKKYVPDPIEHISKRNRGQVEQYYIREHHEPVISKEQFEQVQKIMEEKAIKYKFFRNTNSENYGLFKGKLRCGFCGGPITRSKREFRHQYYSYYCSHISIRGAKYCTQSRYIDEPIFIYAIKEAFKRLKKYNSNNENYTYVKNTMKQVENDYKKIVKELIECIVLGDEVDPYTIFIILKNNNIIEKKIDETIIDFSKYARLFDFYLEKEFMGINEYKTIEYYEGFDVVVYLDEEY